MSQLPAGFVGKNAEIGAANKKAQALASSQVNFTDLTVTDVWTMLGSACPTEPIEVRSINKYNIVQYPGLDDQQAQNMGNHYEPIQITGRLDFQDFERGVGNLLFYCDSGDIDDFDYISTVQKASEFKTGGNKADQGDKTLIDQFFNLLLERQRLGRQFLLEVYIQDPFSTQEIKDPLTDKGMSADKTTSVVQGYSQVSVYGVITEISFKLMQYGRWQYNIVFQPISPAELTSKKAVVVKQTSGLNKFKDAMDDANAAIDTYVDGTFDTINAYYNQYVMGPLGEFKGLIKNIENIADQAINLANLPANLIGTLVSTASDVMTWAEKLTSNAIALKATYESIGDINLAWTSTGASNVSAPTAPTEYYIKKFDQDSAKNNLGFAPKLEDIKLQKINLIISEPVDVKQDVNITDVLDSIDAKITERETDRLIKKAIAPVIMAAKDIIIKNSSVSKSYQTYICKYNDSLRLIANRFYGDVNQWHTIASFNMLPGDNLEVGQEIKVPIL